MKNIFKIYKRDIKSIFTNWVALVIVLAIIILPSLYAWFNIKACWDPYGNTQGIKVAIVNEDKGGNFNNKQYYIGEEIIEKLKDNNAIGWQFVSNVEASEGVENGTYYASIVIPENFTEDLLSLATDNIVKPSLEYTVNEKSNAIAPKITDKGVSSIKEEVSSNVVKTVNGVIFNVFDQIGIEFSGSRNVFRNLIDTLYKVNDNMPQIEEYVDKAADGAITLDELIVKLNGLIPTVSETVTKSTDFLEGGLNYLEKFKTTVSDMAPVIKDDLILSESIVKNANDTIQSIDTEILDNNILNKKNLEGLNVKLTNANKKVINIIGFLDSLLESNPDSENASKLKDSKSKLEEINKNLEDAINKVNESISEIDNVGSTSLVTNLNGLKEMLPNVDNSLNNIINSYDSSILPTINSEIAKVESISNNISYLLEQTQTTLPDVQKVLNIAGEGTDIAIDDIEKLQQKLPDIEGKLNEFVNKIKDVDDEAEIDKLLDLVINNSDDTSNFLSNPIDIEETKLFPVPNYGSAMSPFYSTLALWVGATILVSLLTTHAESENENEEYTAIEEYFGKGLTFVSIGILQGFIVTLGDIVLLKTYVLHPVKFVLFGMLISLVFVLFVYTLVSVFGNVGKALAIILLVLQVAASGGTFPVEVMSGFFQKIHPLLPFKYAIGIMRETSAGIVESLLIKDVKYLMLYFIFAILMGVILKAFINKHTKKLSEKLAESKIAGH